MGWDPRTFVQLQPHLEHFYPLLKKKGYFNFIFKNTSFSLKSNSKNNYCYLPVSFFFFANNANSTNFLPLVFILELLTLI